jgi:hypothetical protein
VTIHDIDDQLPQEIGDGMTWEYRVMSNKGELGIYEVYYFDYGIIKGYSSEAVVPKGGSLDELREEALRYIAALDKPVLEYEDD